MNNWSRRFEQDGSFSAVSTETQSLQADVHLMSNLREFQTRYQGEQASVVIELDAKLIDPSTRAVLAAKRFSIQQPLEDTAIESVVNHFGTASEQLASELLAWSRSALGTSAAAYSVTSTVPARRRTIQLSRLRGGLSAEQATPPPALPPLADNGLGDSLLYCFYTNRMQNPYH
ncbi:ABC-type transport auxiliary lipoprotein family protein [Halopseudomonas pachastrellae]|nr:ABC-type transport auxiliary lipoprotein family protein [Halopseudomonas pachastrellae]